MLFRSAQADWNPYPCMNRLQLGWLLGESIDDAMLEHCLASARKRFARSFDFFDGAMVADCALTRWLVDEPAGELDSAASCLVQAYRDALGMLAVSSRQLGSVVKQLGLLAGFVELRAGEGDGWRAAVLTAAATALGKGLS